MIDKINGNEVYGYADQKKRKNPAVKAYENTPGQKDAAGSKVGQKHSKGSREAEKGSQGVILDLSNPSGKEKAGTAKGEGTSFADSLTQALRQIFAPVIRWLKDFWESDSSRQAAGRMDEKQSGTEQAALNGAGLEPDAKDGAGKAAEYVDMSAAQAAADGTEPMQGQAGASAEGMPGVLESDERSQAAMDQKMQGTGNSLEDQLTAGPASDRLSAAGGLEKDAEAQMEQSAYEILESSRMEEDSEGLPPLEDIDDLPEYGAVSDEAVRSASLEQIEQMLTRNGTRHLAHNSDLLTYYDRWGRLIELDETQRYRVLHGDKNVLKL